MEERALRSGWNLPDRIKSTIVSRLVDVVEREDSLDEEGVSITSDRYLIAAAKTLVYADLGQQRLEFSKQQLAARLEAAKPTTETSHDPSGDAPKRIIIPDVDDRLESRED
jgi:hypothetical protein